jgi:hypothetical protein
MLSFQNLDKILTHEVKGRVQLNTRFASRKNQPRLIMTGLNARLLPPPTSGASESVTGLLPQFGRTALARHFTDLVHRFTPLAPELLIFSR